MEGFALGLLFKQIKRRKATRKWPSLVKWVIEHVRGLALLAECQSAEWTAVTVSSLVGLISRAQPQVVIGT